ncbi:hypothetical protein WQE_36540 [Paraburkholderia hospita]|uniref:Uncharacterized protein n=1 Tax=Paraburkholderia hospita TaxID=169430 RepID=A0AAN1MLB4_9BURK|nr:hypothetical protein C2L64_23190 [Paraburkholderia hospita]EIM96040.1 hypothetical protein WQE_36540 [Paraburkholderia hospita]OUL75422.1 hypothetical protein CA602_36410 [Paraburkholderia hospita]
MMQACNYAVGLAVVNRHIAPAAPFTIGARSMDRLAKSACAMPCRTSPQTLPDASLMQNRRNGHNETT